MRLLAKWTSGLAKTRINLICKQHASSSSPQCTKPQKAMSSATMGEPLFHESHDLSTWSTDHLITRVAFLEKQLKEQTLKYVCLSALLQAVLIA